MLNRTERCPVCGSLLVGGGRVCKSCGAVVDVNMSYDSLMREVFLMALPRL